VAVSSAGGGASTAAYAFSGGTAGWLSGANVPASGIGYPKWQTPAPISGFTQPTDAAHFTCQVAGRYGITAIVSLSGFTSMAYTLVSVAITRAGATSLLGGASQGETTGWYDQVSVEAMADLMVGDVVAIRVDGSAYVQSGGLGLDSRGTFTITPIGGPKGDPGAVGPPGGTQSGTRRRHSVNQAVPQNAATLLQLDTQVDLLGTETWAYDTTNRWVTIPSDGLYLVQGQIQGNGDVWAATTTYGALRINGVDVALQYPSGSQYDVIQPVASLPLKAGDHVSLLLYQNVVASSLVRGQASAAGAPISPMLAIWRMGSGAAGPQGVKGDPGDPGILANASYYYATSAQNMVIGTTPSPIPWQTVLQASGFSATPSAAIVCQQPGKYRVAAQLSGSVTTASAYRICRLALYTSGGVAKATRDVVNPATPTNGWGTWFAEAIFDMVAGDYVRVEPSADVNISLDQSGRNWVEISPIGGTKGDTGPQGPDVTLVQSSSGYLGVSAGPVTVSVWNVLGWLAPAAPSSFLNGFTLASSGVANSNIVCTQAGRYRVQVELSVYNGAATAWTQVRLAQYNAAGTLIASHDLVGNGISTAGWYTGPSHEAMFQMAVGDYIQASMQPGTTGSSVDVRSSLLIQPVGGTKGDKGDKGDQGLPGGTIVAGGTTGQHLAKRSNADNDTLWTNPFELVLTGTDFNALTTTGLYSINRSATNGPPNVSGSVPGICTVVVSPTGDVMQTFTVLSSALNGQTWQRVRLGIPGTWATWVMTGGDLIYTRMQNLNLGSMSGGGGDTNFWTFTASRDGFIEVIPGTIEYGYSGGGITSALSMIYSNSIGSPMAGGAMQTASKALPALGGGVWGRGDGCAPFIAPITAGNTYVITWRFNYTPSTSNCYVQSYMTLKQYALPL